MARTRKRSLPLTVSRADGLPIREVAERVRRSGALAARSAGGVSISYFVRYDIAVPDLDAFLERYRRVHVPLVAKWPGLQRMILHTPQEWSDPSPVNKGRAVLLAQLVFESEEAMKRAFVSRERAEAREDFRRFMTFEGTVTHQAMRSEQVWP